VTTPLFEHLAAFDAAVDRAFDRARSPAVDRAVYSLSSAADHSLLWHLCAVARSMRDGDIGYAARFSAAMGVESALTNGPVKLAFRRVRPVDLDAVEFRHGLRRPITSSFPSGHATAGFCAATLLGGGPWYGLAAAVAATRVYVRLHHASDVLAGAVLGLALGAGLRRVVSRR
jgi:undecaprenyl-diphosphatase